MDGAYSTHGRDEKQVQKCSWEIWMGETTCDT